MAAPVGTHGQATKALLARGIPLMCYVHTRACISLQVPVGARNNTHLAISRDVRTYYSHSDTYTSSLKLNSSMHLSTHCVGHSGMPPKPTPFVIQEKYHYSRVDNSYTRDANEAHASLCQSTGIFKWRYWSISDNMLWSKHNLRFAVWW